MNRSVVRETSVGNAEGITLPGSTRGQGGTNAGDRVAAPPRSATRFNFTFTDFSLLGSIWALIVLWSVRDLGPVGPALVLVLNAVATLRSPLNGLLVLLVIFYTPAPVLGIGPIFSVATVIGIAGWIAKEPSIFVRCCLRSMRVPHTIGACLFVATLALSLVFAPDFSLGLSYAERFFASAIFLAYATALLARHASALDIVLKWWIVVAALSLVIRFLHSSIGPDSALYQMAVSLNPSDYTIEQRLSVLVGSSSAMRLLWPGEEPNYTAAALVFPFGLSIGYALQSKRTQRALWTLCAVAIATSIFGTFSRSGVIAAATAVIPQFARTRRAVFPALVIMVGSVLVLPQFPELASRLSGIRASVTEDGATGRFEFWQLALESWASAPILGHGVASYYATYRDAAHNSYLQVAAENGLVGVLLYLSVFALPYFGVGATQQQHRLVTCKPTALAFSLIGLALMLATLTFQDVKIPWLACACVAFARLHGGVPASSVAAGALASSIGRRRAHGVLSL